MTHRFLRMSHRLAVLLLACAAAGAAAACAPRPGTDGPPVPFEDPGACPFEGCVYREWVATETVAVHRDRQAGSGEAFRVDPGEQVTALTGVNKDARA